MIDDGASARVVDCLFSTPSFSFCRCSSSRRISSSMRLANKYRRIHFPRLTGEECQIFAVGESEWEILNLPLWSSLNSMGSSSSSSSAYTSASKQLNGSSTTVRLPELKSTEHHGATASLVLICLSTSSRCFFPKLWTGLHYSWVSFQSNKERERERDCRLDVP